MNTSDVENYPGYADGILGPEMMKEFRAQAARFGAEFVTDDVVRVDFSQRPFLVATDDAEYRAETVIVATGATARELGFPTEKQFQGRGVSYCAVCDAPFFRDKPVLVVGGGDSAFEEATYIAKFASKVYLVHRREEFRASQIMIDRAKATENLEFILNAEVAAVSATPCSTVTLRSTQTGEPWEHRGRRPLRRDRPRPDDGALQGLARPRRGGLPRDPARLDADEHPGRLRRRRRPGPHLPPGSHRGRLRLHGRARRGALPRRAEATPAPRPPRRGPKRPRSSRRAVVACAAAWAAGSTS